MTRAVTRTEPEWDDDERGWALAMLEYEDHQCPGCGGQLDETTVPDHGYLVDHIECLRCRAERVAKDKYAKAHEQHRDNPTIAQPDDLLWIAERIPMPRDSPPTDA